MRSKIITGLGAMALGGAILAGSASAAPNACTFVTKAEYQRVLGKSVRLSSGEGTATCNVFIAGQDTIIPNVHPERSGSFAGITKQFPTRRREPSLGSSGYSATSEVGPFVWARKHGYILAFQSVPVIGTTQASPNAPTQAQMVKLARIAYSRI